MDMEQNMLVNLKLLRIKETFKMVFLRMMKEIKGQKVLQ